MEPDIMPSYPSSAHPLDDDDGEVGSEEDEFGDFGGVVVPCSPLGFADSLEPLSSLKARQPSATPKPATHKYYCSFNHPVEQSQPASTVSSESGMDCYAEPLLHLTNGYAERDHTSGTHYRSSIVGACPPQEETGFADFSVFTEQAPHPWCCGFSPISSTGQWDGRVEGTNLVEQICDLGQGVIMDSEPKSHCAHRAKEKICTKVKHCERRDAAIKQPSQDHHQPQEAAAALGFRSAEHHLGQEDEGKPGNSWWESGHSLVCRSLKTSETQEDAESEEDGEKCSNVPQTCSVYESGSGDPALFCDNLSFEGVSADLEPNVSFHTSQGDQEDEELGNYRHSDSLVNGSMASLRQTKAEKGFHHCNLSATQETPATSNFCRVQSHVVAYTEDEFSDFNRDQEHVQSADVKVLSLGSLPPSDSFADFCSAPMQENGDGPWAEFKDQRAEEEEKTLTHFREQVSTLPTDGDTREEQDRAGQYGVLRRNSCQAPLSIRVQQLLQGSFPETVVPAVDSEEELLSLDALLHVQHLHESEEEKPHVSSAQWMQQGLWWPHQDVHSSLGLQFQWGGSHTNRTLLRCLGVDTKNIGLLEPTKDSVAAVHCPRHTAVTAQTPPGPRDIQDPSTDSLQEALPSSQLDWSGRGLSSSQDGMSPRRAPHFWGRK